MSGVVCVVCPFADDEKLKNIHVDLVLLVWGPALLSTHAPLPPSKPIPLPLSFFCFFPLSFFLFFGKKHPLLQIWACSCPYVSLCSSSSTWDWWLGPLPRSPGMDEAGDWWSWLMGVLAKEILRVLQGLFTPVSFGYPLSVFNKKTLLTTGKKNRKRKMFLLN